jgi:hypothetical protein
MLTDVVLSKRARLGAACLTSSIQLVSSGACRIETITRWMRARASIILSLERRPPRQDLPATRSIIPPPAPAT